MRDKLDAVIGMEHCVRNASTRYLLQRTEPLGDERGRLSGTM